jgi:hypothetical protein
MFLGMGEVVSRAWTSLDHIFTIHSFDTPKLYFLCIHSHTLEGGVREYRPQYLKGLAR